MWQLSVRHGLKWWWGHKHGWPGGCYIGDCWVNKNLCFSCACLINLFVCDTFHIQDHWLSDFSTIISVEWPTCPGNQPRSPPRSDHEYISTPYLILVHVCQSKGFDPCQQLKRWDKSCVSLLNRWNQVELTAQLYSLSYCSAHTSSY